MGIPRGAGAGRARTRSGRAVVLALALVLVRSAVCAGSEYETTYLLSVTDPTSGDAFGASVAGAGLDMLVGAPRTQADDGAAYLFAGATGALVRTFTSPTPGDAAQLGFAVAGAGPGAGPKYVVGAPFAATGTGVVYVYDATAAPPATLTSPSGIAGDQFGFAVAGTTNRIVVGAPSEMNGSGAVYVFDLAGGVPLHVLRPPAAGQSFFGAAVAVSATRILVGAPMDDADAPGAGAAYLFAADTGMPVATLRAAAPAAGGLFGIAVALDSTRAAVGAPASDTTQQGSVHVFDPASGMPVRVVTAAANDAFGASVAIASTDVLGGAPFADTSITFDSGEILVDDGSGQFTSLVPLRPAQPGHFGAAIAPVLPNRVLVGEPSASRAHVYTGCGTACSPRCGNGLPDPGEECDLGPFNCAADCQILDCRTDCTFITCDVGCGFLPECRAGCDDGNPCTLDECDQMSGCIHVQGAVTGACTPCYGCFLHHLGCCDSGLRCPDDVVAPGCNPPECVGNADCDDGNACNGAETCTAGACAPGTAPVDGTDCSDANPCNGKETCLDLACVAGSPPSCFDAATCSLNPVRGACTTLPKQLDRRIDAAVRKLDDAHRFAITRPRRARRRLRQVAALLDRTARRAQKVLGPDCAGPFVDALDVVRAHVTDLQRDFDTCAAEASGG